MNRRVGLLLPGAQTAVGGAGMRWRALRDALAPQGCVVQEITCDRRTVCAFACGMTSTTPDADEFIWYHNRKFCRAYADDVLKELAIDNVSTIVCSGLETFEYVNYFASHGGVRVIYDMHNVEHVLYRDIQQTAPEGSRHAKLFTDEHVAMVARAEASAVASATLVWCCSGADRRALVSIFPHVDQRKIRVVPNVVSTPMEPPALLTEPRHAYFVGRLDHYPNKVAADLVVTQIAPLLAESGSPIPVVVAGAYAGSEFSAGTCSTSIKILNDPVDIAPLLHGGVLVLPLTIGGGSRLKVLEAFAAGAPVVSTAKGVEGLDVEAGTHYLPAETPQDFVAAILMLIRDRPRRTRIAVAAWALARERYSVHALTLQFAEGDDFC
jgi:glycosyltransferase involved in cell wall biosynthesis